MTDQERIAAGFELAHRLIDPDFRAYVARYGGGANIIMATMDDTVGYVINRLRSRVDDVALLAIPDTRSPYGIRLVRLDAREFPDDGS